MQLVSQPITRIFSEIEAEYRQLSALYARLSVKQLSQSLPGIGTPVDVMIHIAAWKDNALRVAREQAKPGAPALAADSRLSELLGIDRDRFNADLRTEYRGWVLDQAQGWHNNVHRELMQALAVLPSARLLGGSGPYGARQWYIRPALLHSREHRQELEESLFHRRITS